MEILILGLARGSVYALVAVGFVLVFSVGGILNLAHGTLFMLGAYFTYIYLNYVFVAAGTVALLASIALSVATVAVLALLLYLIVFRRNIESISYVMVISLAFALFVEQIMKLAFGVTSTGVPALVRGQSGDIGRARAHRRAPAAADIRGRPGDAVGVPAQDQNRTRDWRRRPES